MMLVGQSKGAASATFERLVAHSSPTNDAYTQTW